MSHESFLSQLVCFIQMINKQQVIKYIKIPKDSESKFLIQPKS